MDTITRRSVILADAFALVREGMAAICQSLPNCAVVGQCSDAAETLDAVARLQPDIVLIDANLPGMHTPEIARRVRESSPATKLVLASERHDRALLMAALRQGIDGFILKAGPVNQLCESFEAVLRGEVYVSRAFADRMSMPNSPSSSNTRLASLTSREYQVYTMLVEGVRAKEIANRLALSPKTVDTHRASLMRKLELYDVASLVKFSIFSKVDAKADSVVV